MTTDRHNNRSRGMRSVEGVTGDCSSTGTASKLSPASRAALRANSLHGNVGLRWRPSADPKTGHEPLPIWLAALLATRCQASVNGEDHIIRWDCIAGRALYTNHGTKAERIEPLGVQLQGGHTVAVYWRPGETNYTVEVYSQSNHFCA
ncbi:MAG TPA: hypothetical protein VKB88_14270 [Bryobacteraceae bacterium]|nr:hypothetical protein [Bryobacteraceae bacterium]